MNHHPANPFPPRYAELVKQNPLLFNSEHIANRIVDSAGTLFWFWLYGFILLVVWHGISGPGIASFGVGMWLGILATGATVWMVHPRFIEQERARVIAAFDRASLNACANEIQSLVKTEALFQSNESREFLKNVAANLRSENPARNISGIEQILSWGPFPHPSREADPHSVDFYLRAAVKEAVAKWEAQLRAAAETGPGSKSTAEKLEIGRS